MPKRKPARNAFFFFMIDYKQMEEKKGKTFPGGMNQVSKQAGKIWQNMTEKQREPFKQMEKDAKGKSHEEKLTSQGVPVSIIEKDERKNVVVEREMKMSIQEMVQNSILNDTLATQKYYFIAGNYFCKTKELFYIPAEISVAEFSLQEGILNKFHSFVNPVNLPLGFTYTAKEYAEKTHQLPIPPDAMGEQNLAKLLKEIAEFITSEDNIDELPPLFTSRENAPVVQSIISQFCMDANEDESLFRIYPLDELFFMLKKAAAKYGQDRDEGFPSIHIAQAALDRDQYECQAGISCDHHENLDIGKHCTLSLVCRWAFLFADHICLDLAISLIPGRHVPTGTDTTMSTFSTVDAKPWKPAADEFEDLDEYEKPKRSSLKRKYEDDNNHDDDLDVKPIFDDDDDDDSLRFKDENVWGIKRKHVSRPPAADSLKFGRGGNRTAAGPSRGSQRAGRSYGRGQLLDYD